MRSLWSHSAPSEIHYCLTRDLRVLYCSPSYERLMGASLGDLWADTTSFLAHIHPEDREGVLSRMHRLSDARSGLCTQVFRAGETGNWQWFSAGSNAVDEFILGQCRPVPEPQGHWTRRLADWEQNFDTSLAFGSLDWNSRTIQWISPRGIHLQTVSLSPWSSLNPTQLELPGLARELAQLLPERVAAVYALPGQPVPGLLACSQDAPVLPGLARICAWTLEEPGYRPQPERMAELRDQLWKSVARELHDELGQLLTACKLQTQLIDGNRTTVQNLSELLDQALDGTRRVAWRLRSMQLEPEDFMELARRRAKEIEKATALRISIQDRLPHHRIPTEHQATLGQIAQECLTNCLRHSQAQTIEVVCWAESDWLYLRVGDDGRGCGGPPVAGMGLTGIAERLQLLGGSLSIESSPSNGFQLTASLPWVPPPPG
ncbi:MAG: PAS domain-containing protein [Candidatus Eremiobacteraeota bacterium]|nr:PAS domain-containing protein [Candidatus Eremiobacteraeota bacterium]